MIGRAQGPRRPQGPRPAHRARRRHRRRDGQRHLHPHRHHAEVLHRALHCIHRQHRRRHLRQGDRQELHQRQRGHDPRVHARQGPGAPRGRGRRRRVSPQEANVADIIGSDGKKPARRASAAATTPPTRASARSSSRPARPPHGPGEVAIDAGTAEKKHYKVGDSVVVSTLGKKHTFRISGTLSYGDVDSLGFASIAAWDVKTAQALLDREGRYDVISVAAKDGTSSASS